MQVGLVTYGTHVHVHELGFSECAKAYVFQVRPPLYHSWDCTLTLQTCWCYSRDRAAENVINASP